LSLSYYRTLVDNNIKRKEETMRTAKVLIGSAALLICSVFVLTGISYSQQPPASQTIGGQTRQDQDIKKARELEQKIETKKAAPAGTAEAEIVTDESGPKTMVKTITVEGATLLGRDEVRNIVAAYEGQALTLRAIQKIADLITDEYRKKGYVTSRAYIPPQTITDGNLVIRVVEGKLGKIEVKGNRFFKSSLLEQRLSVEPSGYFDYSELQKSLIYINEHPDRKARATLMPGTAPGTTDVVVEVTDQLPIHAGFEFDNFGSRYIGKKRYALVLEHNNLLGFDDKLYLKGQMAEANRMHLEQARYGLPISRDTSVGAYLVNSQLKLGKEFKDVNAQGKAEIYGLFLSQSLIHGQTMDLRLNLGFDYKRIRNFLAGAQTSRDQVRMLKVGADLDIADFWGRNIISPEINQGFSDILGGMEDKDPNASRVGSGGTFTKGILNYYRLQRLPLEMTLLWKNNAQYSNHTLVASEEFQIGGATSVRGYPPAEKAGDKGLYSSPEISFPIYFLPKDWAVPFTTDEKLYTVLRTVVFFDWGTTHIRSPQAGDKKHETLRGWGFGWRFNLKDNISARIEIGYPIGHKTPSDGDHAHPWIEVRTKF